MLRRTLLLLLVGGLSAAPAVAQAPPADPKAAPATVPFKLLPSRHMLVELTFNGKGPYRVIFDTGAPLNLVNPKLAKESGILKKGESGGMSLFSGPKSIDVAKVGLGTATLANMPVIVMDHPTVKAISNAFEDEYGTIDGIVGFPLFSRFATTVDYQKRELTLTPSAYKPGDYLKDLTDTLTKASDNPGPKVVGAAGLWGFRVGEGESDAEDAPAGVVVKEVYADSPASKAGLKVGDRIATIDRRWTDTVADAYLATSLVKPGRTVELAVARGVEKLTLKCTPVKGY